MERDSWVESSHEWHCEHSLGAVHVRRRVLVWNLADTRVTLLVSIFFYKKKKTKWRWLVLHVYKKKMATIFSRGRFAATCTHDACKSFVRRRELPWYVLFLREVWNFVEKLNEYGCERNGVHEQHGKPE